MENFETKIFCLCYFMQRNSSFDTRYKFSAKELDSESGYNYFGARYYDSELSNWLSVDPMASKYPSLSPYVYVANNPVMLFDPDGRDIDPATAKKVEHFVDPQSKSYNPAFADKYNALKQDQNAVYFFNNNYDASSSDLGNVTYNGTNNQGQYLIGINYSEHSGTSGLSAQSSLLEETYHAYQFSKGDFGFLSNDVTFALDIFDEAEAKIFAAINTRTTRYNLENSIIKSYNRNGIDGVVEFILNRPSMKNIYGGLPNERINVKQYLDDNNNQHLSPYFKENGQSRFPNIIMQKPR